MCVCVPLCVIECTVDSVLRGICSKTLLQHTVLCVQHRHLNGLVEVAR